MGIEFEKNDLELNSLAKHLDFVIKESLIDTTKRNGDEKSDKNADSGYKKNNNNNDDKLSEENEFQNVIHFKKTDELQIIEEKNSSSNIRKNR